MFYNNKLYIYLILNSINYLFKFINYFILGQIQMVQARLPQRQQTVSILAKEFGTISKYII